MIEKKVYTDVFKLIEKYPSNSIGTWIKKKLKTSTILLNISFS